MASSNRKCVFLKRVGETGVHSKLTEQSFNDLLEICNEHCLSEKETLVFPLFPKLQYDGPTGLNEVAEKIDREKVGNVIGDSNELKVLRMFEEVSRSQNLGLKLFPGIKFDQKKLEVLASSFDIQPPDKNFFKEMFPNKRVIEADLICIYKGAICLLEVKSNSRPETIWVSRFFRSRCYVRQFFLRQFFWFSSTIQEWVVFRPCFRTCHWSKSELIEVKQDNI
jgi:hypothetical protein